MTPNDFVVIGGVGLLLSVPLNNNWKIGISVASLLLGMFGKGFSF